MSIELFDLSGKNAVVIGGGGHLCSEMARALSKAGASIALLDKNPEKLKAVSESIIGSTLSIPFDVTKKDQHESACEKIVKEFGSVDILINGAGINAPTPFFDISLDEWNAILESHITGTFLGCQIFGKQMVLQKKG